MTSYVAIPDADIDQDSPVTQPLMTALRDNLVSALEGDSSAPGSPAGWLNYDGTATLTPIYDFSVDGTVAEIVSPDFADGWEYHFIFEGVTTDGGVNDDLRVAFYLVTGASYTTVTQLVTDISSLLFGYLTVFAPRLVLRHTYYESRFIDTAATGAGEAINYINERTIAQKLGKAKFTLNLGNFNGGKIYMLRRQFKGAI